MAWVYLVMCLAVIFYTVAAMNVGRLRQKHGILAPACAGHPEFERAFRVQQNTLEQLVLFLPALWLFALLVSAFWGALIGLVWIAGRALYALAYLRAPETRGPGFAIAAMSSLVLLLGALIGAVVNLR